MRLILELNQFDRQLLNLVQEGADKTDRLVGKPGVKLSQSLKSVREHLIEYCVVH